MRKLKLSHRHFFKTRWRVTLYLCNRLRRFFFYLVISLGLSLALAGCMSQQAPAPVEDLSQQSVVPPGYYRVKPGDTLYSIAWSTGLDYRALAVANHLKSPYQIAPGQMLKVSIASKAQPRTTRHFKKRKPIKTVQMSQIQQRLVHYPAPRWRWPVRGPIIEGFSKAMAGNHGIDIGGHFGEALHAAAKGIVVYSGAGIRGYGNLIIIKHNDSFLSAYAFNEKNAVKLGQRVKAGQTIAFMGRNNAGKVTLHFEIRRNGKPINPLGLL